MIVGVINKRFSNSKMIGSVINYNLLKGSLQVRIFLDANKKKLIIFTPNNPQGEVFTDLPKDGLFYPAI
jgi:histidinol-phosphate/aromatic aminotransferase/cobyric acid decarboxylase-like protein